MDYSPVRTADVFIRLWCVTANAIVETEGMNLHVLMVNYSLAIILHLYA